MSERPDVIRHRPRTLRIFNKCGPYSADCQKILTLGEQAAKSSGVEIWRAEGYWSSESAGKRFPGPRFPPRSSRRPVRQGNKTNMNRRARIEGRESRGTNRGAGNPPGSHAFVKGSAAAFSSHHHAPRLRGPGSQRVAPLPASGRGQKGPQPPDRPGIPVQRLAPPAFEACRGRIPARPAAG